MITIKESSRDQGGCDLVCECGNKVKFAMHWDYLEGTCMCGKQYVIKVKDNIWNCCSGAENDCLYAPEGKRGIPYSFEIDASRPSINQIEWVFEKLLENNKGSFRHLIYDVMGLSGDAYEKLYKSGGMVITNLLSESE